MAFIQIIQLKDGQTNCSKYFFKNGVPDMRCHIEPGEIAYVPDEEMDLHESKGYVIAVDGRSAKSKVINPEDMPQKDAA